MVRGAGTIVCIAMILDEVLSSGVIELILGFFLTIPIMGCLLLLASEGAMIFVYLAMQESTEGFDNKGKAKAIVCELVSITALGAFHAIFRMLQS